MCEFEFVCTFLDWFLCFVFVFVCRLYELNKHSVFLTTCCENIPQIIIRSVSFFFEFFFDSNTNLFEPTNTEIVYVSLSTDFTNTALLNAFISFA